MITFTLQKYEVSFLLGGIETDEGRSIDFTLGHNRPSKMTKPKLETRIFTF